MKWSKYQEKIFEVAENTTDNIVVEAVPGSGKTTTIVELAKMAVSGKLQVPSKNGALNAQFLAFNKSIATELNERLPTELPASTINAYGYRLLREHIRNLNVNGYKYSNLSKAYAKIVCGDNWHEQAVYAAQITGVLNMFRINLVDLDDWDQIVDVVDTYSLDFDPDLMHVYKTLLEMGEAIATPEGFSNPVRQVKTSQQIASGVWANIWDKHKPKRPECDFIDQIYLPVHWSICKPDLDLAIVDESQDLSYGQLELILQSLKPNGRLIAVGDSWQSIYMFGGAGSDSIDRIIERTNATTLPLSVSYRLPKSHVRLVQEINPEVQATDWATEGTIEYIDSSLFVDTVRAFYELDQETMILARRNAPLIKNALALIAKRLPAKVRGRDFSSQLTNVIKSVALGKNGLKRGFEWESFGDHLYEWYQREWNKLKKRSAKEQAFQALNDKLESLRILYSETDAKDVHEFIEDIANLFDDGKNLITLSTVHKSKGLECGEVMILEPEKMPLIWKGITDKEYEQEMNVKLVALSRSKNGLYFVIDENDTEEFEGMV